jgi:uncharacterized coiled-coil protein SlyX
VSARCIGLSPKPLSEQIANLEAKIAVLRLEIEAANQEKATFSLRRGPTNVGQRIMRLQKELDIFKERLAELEARAKKEADSQ